MSSALARSAAGIGSGLLPLLLLAASATPAAAAMAPPMQRAEASGQGADAAAARAVLPDEDAVDILVAQGRAHLDAGRVEQAQVDFDLAASMDGDSLRTRTWVLRGWIAAGRTNDALTGTDALARAHPEAGEIDYLYGMSFAYEAQAKLAAGVTDGNVGMQFQDAADFLARATAADPERYRDGHLALALAAWYTQPPRLDVARAAAEAAVTHYPDKPKAWFQLGRVAFSLYVSLRSDPASAVEARSSWERTLEAFGRVLDLVGLPTDREGVQLVGDARVQRGNAYLWEGDTAAAASEFAEAMGWNPAAVDLAQLSGQLGASFAGALERGLQIRAEHKDPDSPNSATLHWWLGYTRYQEGAAAALDPAAPEGLAAELLARSEAQFLRCLELRPDFTNSWFYLGHGRYAAGEYASAVDAFRTYWDLDPAGFVAYVSAAPDYNVPRLEYLTGVAFRSGDLPSAAALAEACANGLETVAAHWNNLGLFLRDHADALKQSSTPVDPSTLAQLHERAYTAYSRALALEPDSPALLNDTAVMLDYYLDRDLERALSMYEQAAARAEVLLADPELDEAEAKLARVALRDARNNSRRLAKRLEHRAQPTGAAKPSEDAVEGGPADAHGARTGG